MSNYIWGSLIRDENESDSFPEFRGKNFEYRRCLVFFAEQNNFVDIFLLYIIFEILQLLH
jgi:hypothetical protein